MRYSKKSILIFILPAFIWYNVGFFYPAIQALRVSLCEWSGFTANMRYIGLDNFKELTTDDIFWHSLQNNLFIVFVGGGIMISLSLFFANALSRNHSKIKSFLINTIFTPYVLAGVAIALLWNFIYNPQFGLLNGILRTLSLGYLSRPWLSQSTTAIPAITIAAIWWWIGFYMVLFIAGMQRIPPTLYEAARIDGATGWQRFLHITLPLLREALVICVVMWVIDSLKFFDLIYVMVRGCPPDSLQVIGTYLYVIALGQRAGVYRMGYGTAIGVVLFVLILTPSIIYLHFARRKTFEY